MNRPCDDRPAPDQRPVAGDRHLTTDAPGPSHVRAVAPPPSGRAEPSPRTGPRVGCLAMGGVLLWGILLALYWVRAAHAHWGLLMWSGQVLVTLLVSILVVTIVGSLTGIEPL